MLVTEVIGAHGQKAHIVVHKAGCRDLSRIHGGESYTEEHDSAQSVVESVYGPEAGSFYAESGIPEDEHATAWKNHGYADDFHFAPCTSALPYDRPCMVTCPVDPDKDGDFAGCGAHFDAAPQLADAGDGWCECPGCGLNFDAATEG